MKYKLPALVILFFFHSFAFSQSKTIRFDKLNMTEGLSQSTVLCIFQDSKGFMWFGTRDGLNKYDGYHFTVFRKNPLDKNSLSENNIRAIAEDKKGRLWIGTWGGGVNRYDPETNQFVHFTYQAGQPNSLSDNYVTMMYCDKDGILWIGTENGGLNIMDPENKHPLIRTSQTKRGALELKDNHINTFLQDARGDYWAGSTTALYYSTVERSNFRSLPPPYGLPGNIRFIFEDSSKHLWVGTYGNGLYTNDSTGAFKRYVPAPPNHIPDFLLTIAEDKQGNLIIGTENNGVVYLDPATRVVTSYVHNDNDYNSISSNTINTIMSDAKGNIWMGSSSGGINIVNRDAGKFEHFRHKENNSLSHDVVTSIYEDHKGQLWLGTEGGGLDQFNPGTKEFRHFNNQAGNNFVLSIYEDAKGLIWIGTWGNGITQYNPATGTYRYYKHDPANPGSLRNNNAWFITADQQQNIWVGTYGGGLEKYDPLHDTFIHYRHEENNAASISSDFILTIREDRHGRLWIGTDGGGLDLYDPATNKFTAYKQGETAGSLSSNTVNSILEDQQGTLWIGTNYGLNKLSPGSHTFTTYLTQQGLINNVITGIQEDTQQQLWISSPTGITRYDPGKNTFDNFTNADGLQGIEYRISLRTQSGALYFGGKGGFSRFLPATIRKTPFDPPILFTSFQLFNKEVPVAADSMHHSLLQTAITNTKELHLSYRQSMISFEFASLNYTSNDRKQYAYKLEGYDDNWNYIGTKNNVTFTNLDPGHYTLKVKGLNNEGAWSDKVASIDLYIAPPFWKTWWFRFCTLAAIAGIILFIYYKRLSGIKKRNRELAAEVEKRTHELSEANLILKENNEEIKTQNEQLEDYNEEIVRQSNKILQQQQVMATQNVQLEHSVKELEALNHTKDRFYSILAHDLKNPVYALSGIATLLRKKFPQMEPAEVYDYITRINTSTTSLYSLLLSLLDWTRTQTGNIVYHPVNIGVYELVMKNVTLMEQLLRNKEIAVSVNIHPELALYADLQMIDTVIRNLLGNSIKFTHPQGQIFITAQTTGNNIDISIRDTGIGMTTAQTEKLFNIAHNQLSKGTAGESGTGLGLIICKEFLEVNHGHITVNSDYGHGTTFVVSVPAAATGGITPIPVLIPELTDTPILFPESEEKLKKIRGKRILIVDDNLEIRSYLRLLLSGIFEIFEAENGEAGIQEAAKIQPGIIISDVMMPVMDGREFCKRIKSNAATCHIPLVLLTSQASEDSQLSGYEAGADAYLTKPVHGDILLLLIQNLMQNQETIRQKFFQTDEIYPEGISIAKLDEAFLHQVIAFIEENLSDEDLDYKKLCQHANMSRTVLYEKIKTITGQGVHDFIKSIRLKKSLKHLLEGKLSITQIAYEVGFNTPSYFTKSFAKHYGMGPKEYVKEYKQAQGLG